MASTIAVLSNCDLTAVSTRHSGFVTRRSDGVISALGDDRRLRPKTRYLPHVWTAMKAAGVKKYIGMGSRAMMMPGESRGVFQGAVHPC